MDIDGDLLPQLQRISKLRADEIAAMEENVKLKVAVPLLDAFGHRGHLHFEQDDGTGRRMDIVVTGLPRDSQVIIETKAAGKRLDEHLFQVRDYLRNSGALLAFLTNGDEVRAYSPIQGFGIEECCIFRCFRLDLAKTEVIENLKALLARHNLLSRRTKTFVRERQDKIVEIISQVDEVKAEADIRRRQLLEDIGTAESMIREFRSELDEIDGDVDRRKKDVLVSSGLPVIDSSAPIGQVNPVSRQLPGLSDSTDSKLLRERSSPASRIESWSGGRKASDTTLSDLFEAKLLKDGQTIFRETRGAFFEATFEAPDKLRIVLNGRAKYHSTLSGAAVDLTGVSTNGWIWWRIGERNGQSKPLDALRREYQSRRRHDLHS